MSLDDPMQEWHSLTLGQLDFWEEYRAHPGQAVSTVAHLTVLEGDVDEAALAEAISRATAEADVLALRFCDGVSGEAPLQRVDPEHRPVLRQIDLRGHADPEGHARALMQVDLDRPLDLCGGPLSASWLIRTDSARWLWYCRGHHIFLDGYSMALIERRVAQLYAHLVQGADPGRSFAAFHRYLEEEDTYRASARHQAAGAFWRDYLNQGPAPQLLQKGSENYPASPRSAEISLAGIVGPLRDRAMGARQGWPDLLIALTGLWLWARPGDDTQPPCRDQLIWLPVMNRLGSVSAAMPAMVVNILPFRITPNPKATLTEVLAIMGDGLKQLRRHGRYRIEQIAADRGIGTGQRFFFSPLVNVLPFDPPEFPGCRADREVLAAGPGDGFNVTFAADGRGEGLMLYLDADPKLTSQQRFEDHCTGLPAFLSRALSGADDDRLADLLDLAAAS